MKRIIRDSFSLQRPTIERMDISPFFRVSAHRFGSAPLKCSTILEFLYWRAIFFGKKESGEGLVRPLIRVVTLGRQDGDRSQVVVGRVHVIVHWIEREIWVEVSVLAKQHLYNAW